jgi:hypothetical protein
MPRTIATRVTISESKTQLKTIRQAVSLVDWQHTAILVYHRKDATPTLSFSLGEILYSSC